MKKIQSCKKFSVDVTVASINKLKSISARFAATKKDLLKKFTKILTGVVFQKFHLWRSTNPKTYPKEIAFHLTEMPLNLFEKVENYLDFEIKNSG